ncbi:protein mono-ADP-ribosyltransferase TIPARP-like [Trichosurus vulpecula]|uniref:protein mono-ADP-ribosyltransferase TIPARP-like n=1 Tax=Trichosurus vulpecula TaxID=9337 RepID=UPI00186B4652|nr:protein mono-ADP-ribosyltransferase TIPARP-like [Trichosurus vulpecula]
MHLEMIHADPNFETADISFFGEKMCLDMKEKKFTKVLSSFDFARRLCCKDDSFFTPPNNIYFLSGSVWTLYSQDIHQLLSSAYQQPLGFMNFQELKMIVRPKYVPLYQNVNDLRIWFSNPPTTFAWWGEEPTDIYIGKFPCKDQVSATPDTDEFSLREVAPSELAYQQCCQLFHASAPPEHFVVLRIYRYYNRSLWELYLREKRRLKNLQIPSPLEYHLFYQGHISLEYLTSIGLCPKTRSGEGILGRGLYFSLNAYLATSNKNPSSGYMTVLAKVLVGEKTLGHPFIFDAPFKPNGQEYDSCVNDIDMPTLFCVFRKELIYPYFIITYRCLTDEVHMVF